ncbi:MAG: hypothetical protein H6811_11400 [Phycisphaeraceae bacterium]|nr:hypothetical protein [Phycisphaeraceae bacterium]
MGQMVLLEHTTAEDGVHFDWLLERDSEEERRLISFRVSERIDLTAGARWRAQRIRDHRAVFLAFEGQLSGGRGHVRRVAAGACEIVEETADRLRARVDWGMGTRVIRAESEGSAWIVRAE